MGATRSRIRLRSETFSASDAMRLRINCSECQSQIIGRHTADTVLHWYQHSRHL